MLKVKTQIYKKFIRAATENGSQLVLSQSSKSCSHYQICSSLFVLQMMSGGFSHRLVVTY